MAHDDEREKKEKVLHTRIPESLDEEIRQRANRLGISVSNLVRNALHHAFGLVEDIVTDSASLGRAARGEDVAAPPAPAPASAPPTPARVLGWQLVILNLNAICERCNQILPKGTEAALGATDAVAARPILCKPCMEEVIRA